MAVLTSSCRPWANSWSWVLVLCLFKLRNAQFDNSLVIRFLLFSSGDDPSFLSERASDVVEKLWRGNWHPCLQVGAMKSALLEWSPFLVGSKNRGNIYWCLRAALASWWHMIWITAIASGLCYRAARTCEKLFSWPCWPCSWYFIKLSLPASETDSLSWTGKSPEILLTACFERLMFAKLMFLDYWLDENKPAARKWQSTRISSLDESAVLWTDNLLCGADGIMLIGATDPWGKHDGDFCQRTAEAGRIYSVEMRLGASSNPFAWCCPMEVAETC